VRFGVPDFKIEKAVVERGSSRWPPRAWSSAAAWTSDAM